MTTYALLVGIDEYRSPLNPLHGCVADVAAIEAVLEARIAKGELRVRQLVNAEATRGNVIAEFRRHLGQAVDGDVVVFWYAGHGSDQATCEAPGMEPNGKDETLVLYDSREPDGADLADDELGALVAEVAKPGVHVFVGLDCCQSGTGTREVLPEGVTIRHAPRDARVRPRSGDGSLRKPEKDARHVLLAACRFDQTAKEVTFAGAQRGAMSAAVERALHGAGPQMTYRQLHRAVRATVAQTARDQVPQLEVTVDADELAVLFDGALREPAGYLLTYDGGRWVLDAGAVHGISPAIGTEHTELEVRDPDDGRPLARATVSAVEADKSIVTVDSELATERTYVAVVTAVPLPPTPVVVAPDLTDVRRAVDRSPFLEAAAEGDIEVRSAGPAIEVVDGRRGTDPVTTLTGDASLVIASLEQIVRWRQLVDLANPGSRLTDVTLDVAEVGAPQRAEPDPRRHNGDEVLLEYRDGTAPRFTATVRNGGTTTVFCALLALGSDYSVASFLPGGAAVKLAPGQEKTTGTVIGTVPDDLWADGVIRRTDVLKLIVSDVEFDPVVLAQGGLPKPRLVKTRDARSAPITSTLSRLLTRVQTRELSLAADSEPISDWSTSSVRVTTERLQPGASVSGDGASHVELASGVTLSAPAGLAATVSLSGSNVVARDLETTLVPPLLIDEPDPWRPMALLATREAAPPLDVLELQHAEGIDAVTHDSPMTLQLPQSLAEGESVLVIGFDGENYLPVGHAVPTKAGGTTIRIDHLPPRDVNTRSLTGSIRLLFRRFVHQLTGKPAEITRLAIPKVTGDKVEYCDDAAQIAAKVAEANSVLLLVHGIIGDTAGLAIGAAKGFGSQHDLMLTFDYESINTTIDVTAAELRKKLVAAGLADKELTIVAHSMGGLVSRWMIEQDRAGLVDHLVTAGTPNGGSPWPVVEDFVTGALAFGLNKLQAVGVWPAVVLSGLVAAIEKFDNALDDMNPKSDKLATLFGGADPHVRYTVLVGDLSLKRDVAPDDRVARILHAIKRAAVDTADVLAFLGKSNDIAVSTESALHLPTGRSPQPVVNEKVACDHLTYFSSDAGLAALSAAVSGT